LDLIKTLNAGDNVRSVLCNTNLGTIENVTVGGTTTIDSFATNSTLTYGAIVGYNRFDEIRGLTGKVINSQVDVTFDFKNKEVQAIIGGVVGINNSTIENSIDGSLTDLINVAPSIKLMVKNTNPDLSYSNNAIIGGLVGENRNTISGARAQVQIQNIEELIVGGVIGENYSGNVTSISGSLISNSKLYSFISYFQFNQFWF